MRVESFVVSMRALSLAALGWGVLAFGAVYPWAYWPLAAACAITGVVGLTARCARSAALPKAVSITLLVFGAAVLLQLVPLPLGSLASVSPMTSETLRAYSPPFAIGLVSHHPLSIEASATWTAFALFAALALLLLGTARALSVAGARRLVEGLTVLGVVVALVGIIQRPLFTGKIYGFWTPQDSGGVGFGPFVNRNHFAGWMLMGLPLTVGLLCGGIAAGLRGVKPGWRNKLLWFGSPDASRLILIAAGAVVMALSLVLTLSRSGMTALVVSLLFSGWFVVRNLRGGWRKTAAVGYLMLLPVVVAGWAGADAIMARFSLTATEFGGRVGAWKDAAAIASAFPVAGTGLNTYGIATLFYQRHEVIHHYEQAHNDYLQLLAEGGLLLAIPAVLLVAALVRETWRRAGETEAGSTTYWLRAGAITAIVAIALQESIDFSLQMPGNAALFAVVCGIALHRAPSSRRSTRTPMPASDPLS